MLDALALYFAFFSSPINSGQEIDKFAAFVLISFAFLIFIKCLTVLSKTVKNKIKYIFSVIAASSS